MTSSDHNPDHLLPLENSALGSASPSPTTAPDGLGVLDEDDHNFWPPYEFTVDEAAWKSRGASASDAKAFPANGTGEPLIRYSTAAEEPFGEAPRPPTSAAESCSANEGAGDFLPPWDLAIDRAAGAERDAPAAEAVFAASSSDTAPAPILGAGVPASAEPSSSRRSYGGHAAGAARMVQCLPLANEPEMFPAFMSRSALFGALRPNTGEYYSGLLEASGDAVVSFAGPRLSMRDKSVWQALARRAKEGRFDAAASFEVPLAEVALDAGLRPSGVRAVRASLERLAQSRVDAKVGGVAFAGSLLAEAGPDGGRFRAQFDPAFAVPALSLVLQASTASAGPAACGPLAQWLRDYFSTHLPMARPFTLGYLMRLSGYGSPTKRFAQDLREAMDWLKAQRSDLVVDSLIEREGKRSENWKLVVHRGAFEPKLRHPPKNRAPSPPAEATWPNAKAVAKRPRGPSL